MNVDECQEPYRRIVRQFDAEAMQRAENLPRYLSPDDRARALSQILNERHAQAAPFMDEIVRLEGMRLPEPIIIAL